MIQPNCPFQPDHPPEGGRLAQIQASSVPPGFARFNDYKMAQASR
jgi:hypothetical protein